MTRWKKDAKEFSVRLNESKNKDGSKSFICRIPVPLLDLIGNPKGLRFEIKGKKIIVIGEK